MWRSKRIKPDIPEQIYKRVSRLPQASITDWIDQALYSTSRCITAYQKTGDPGQLQEAYTGAQVIYAIVDDMVQRLDRSYGRG